MAESPKDIVIAGGHGQIAMLLHPLLKERGHRVRGLIRNPDHADDLRKAGAEPVICDMEQEDDLSRFVEGADVVVFAAGAGPGSGAARKWTVDRDGALKLIDAARKQGVDRYVMISAMNLEQPYGDEVFRTYQQAKAEADDALRNSGLDYTIIRPGRLTNNEPTGRVAAAQELPTGAIPRADVAAVVAEVIDMPGMVQFDLISGDDSVAEAVQRLAGG